MDTSSKSIRQEWYEEDYYPDIPFPRVTLSVNNRMSDKLKFMEEQIASYIGVSVAQMTKAFAGFNQVSNIDSGPETIKDRALRLAKQPHYQAQSPDAFHFDHRGRRRY